jgi:antagonist of KipI
VALLVESPGVWTTIQDLGRTGLRGFGVPVAGAFDRRSHLVANALLGNPPGAATLEMTLVGGVYLAQGALAIALAGAPMSASIETAAGDRLALRIPQSASLAAGDRLRLGGTPRGARTYLAVAGGWQTPARLHSRSAEEPVRAGDVLPARSGWTPGRWPRPEADPIAPDVPIRIIDGPDADVSAGRAWEDRPLAVGRHCDRMGLRLEGPAIEFPHDPDRPSIPVTFGAIQLAGGRPIVLGPAGGTMGGYPVVGVVITADLDRLAQLRPGHVVRFRRVELAEARRLVAARRREESNWVMRLSTIAADIGMSRPI